MSSGRGTASRPARYVPGSGLSGMRVLWTHNFDPAIPGKGSFMHTAAEAVRGHGVELHLQYLGNLRSIRQILRARGRVRRLAQGFDLVHAQFGSACALVTAAVADIPKFVTIRGNDWATHDLTRGFLYYHTRVAAALTRLALKSYDGVIAVSHRIAAQIGRNAPAAAITVLPSPIDLSLFVPRTKAAARAQLGLADLSGKWVLFNSLELHNPIKRFDLARRAFEIAQARRGDLQLRLATNLSHDKVPLFVAACDLILCTSETEGWPNSVKEALACDVPFVATDVSDLREIAARAKSCRVCAPDAAIIAQNICEVLEEGAPRDDLRQYVTGMNLEAFSARLIAAYGEVLVKRRNARAASAH